MDEYITPEIDSGVPLPASATEAMPDLSPQEELDMRARTIKMISDLSGNPIIPKEADMAQAREVAHTILTDPANTPQLAQYNNPTLAYLAGMVAQHDTYIVQELADLKKFVVNRLVAETEDSNPKIRLAGSTCTFYRAGGMCPAIRCAPRTCSIGCNPSASRGT